MAPANQDGVTENQILEGEVNKTSELDVRPSKPSNFRAEAQALVRLCENLSASPQTILTKIAEAAQELCGAGSAGISIAETYEQQPVIWWKGTAGQLCQRQPGPIPRAHCPCGEAMDVSAPILMIDPAIRYPSILRLGIPFRELLIFPFRRNGFSVGTLWVVSHDIDKKFDREDLRILASLASFAAAAFQTQEYFDADRRAQLEREKLEHMFEQAPISLAMLEGPEHRYLFANANYKSHFLAGTDFVGRAVVDVLPGTKAQGFIDLLDTVYGTGQRHVGQESPFSMVQADGTTKQFYFNFVYEPIRGPRGQVEGILAAISDVTEQKKANAEILRAKEEAERANDLKSAFLANMSHEIRTPLGAMLGFADLLRDPSLSEAERENYVNILSRNGESLSVIINDILDLSKVEAGHLTLEFGEVSPEKIVTDVVSLLKVKAREKNLALEYSFASSLPSSIVSDSTRVRQVLLNLVGNAIKFTSAGSIDIYGYGGKTSAGARTVGFEIRDTGIGISESQRDKIFEMFVQADGTMTRRFGGTGLGLALSRRLAQALGGEVIVQHTEEEKGTTFLFTVEDLPHRGGAKMETHRPQPRPSVALGENTLRGIRILVVDDAPDNQQLIWRYLTRYGAQVESAENGWLGYQAALAGHFDIVLMDIQMPVMDGYTATQKLRDEGYEKPIVALTAHAMTEVSKRALDAGYTTHLPKPINLTELILTIAAHTNH